MKDTPIKQIVVITDTDPAEFQKEINKTLQEHNEIESLEYKDNIQNQFCAVITYIEYRKEPENTADIYALEGRKYICNDCPHIELDPDRRSVTHYCSKHRDRVTLKRPACEDFLRALRAGVDHLVTPEERREQYNRMDLEELERRREYRKIIQQTCYYKDKLIKLEKELEQEQEKNKNSQK